MAEITCPPICPPQKTPIIEGQPWTFSKTWWLFFYNLIHCWNKDTGGGGDPGTGGPDHWVRTIGQGNNADLQVGVDVAPRLIVGCPNPASPTAMTLMGVYYMLKHDCTGASVIANPKKNGATAIFSSANRPTVPASDTTVKFQTNMALSSWAHTDYISLDIDQIGSSIPGAGLVMTFVFRTGS